MKIKPILSLLLICLSLVAASAADKPDVLTFLREADQITLYSLSPQEIHTVDEHGNPTEEDRKKERLRGYPVLGKIVITDNAMRESVRQSVIGSLTRLAGGPPALCFEPRHAVCLKKGGQHMDLLICFECEQGKVYYIDIENLELRNEFVAIGLAGRAALNELLDARKIQRDIPKKNTESNEVFEVTK